MRSLRRVAGIFAALLLCAPPANANGVPAYYDDTVWHLLSETDQFAVIALDGGSETLLLRVAIGHGATPEAAERLVWVTPVPAPASDVDVAILRGFPSFGGYRPRAYLASSARGALATMAATQIYTLALIVLYMPLGSADPAGVTVHERIRRDGVELELLAADTPGALGVHLDELGVDFPPAGLDTLKPYAGPDACFVIYRIVDLVAYRKATGDHVRFYQPPSLGVQIRFPAEDGFYPLVASSALPGEQMNVVVTVLGWAMATEPIPPGLWTGHFIGQVEASPEASEVLGKAAVTGKQRYTRFRLTNSPDEFTTDLRFQPGAPAFTATLGSWLTSPYFAPLWLVIGLGLFVAVSMLAGLTARFAWPAEARPSRVASAAIGLANFATLLGVLIASVVTARRLGVPIRRGCRFALFFSAFFCLFLLILAVPTFLIEL